MYKSLISSSSVCNEFYDCCYNFIFIRDRCVAVNVIEIAVLLYDPSKHSCAFQHFGAV